MLLFISSTQYFTRFYTPVSPRGRYKIAANLGIILKSCKYFCIFFRYFAKKMIEQAFSAYLLCFSLYCFYYTLYTYFFPLTLTITSTYPLPALLKITFSSDGCTGVSPVRRSPLSDHTEHSATVASDTPLVERMMLSPCL